MANRPTVSIITATHNALEGLKKTVASVASQTAKSHEHIIIDGGSSDGTKDWLAEQGGLRWISEQDQGITGALNKGLGLARGEWILFLHAEDTFVDAQSLERAMEHLNTASEIVSLDVSFVAGERSRRLASHGLSPRINFKITIPHQGAFCRRTLFHRIGFFDESYRVTMDYEFFLRAHRAGVEADVVHHTMTRMPDSGISSRLDWPSLRARFAEEHAVHLKHARGRVHRLLYAAYFPTYLSYRLARFWFTGRTGLARRSA